jgi:transposase
MEKRKNITSKIKVEIVLSLLRGEDPELVSREYGVTLADINLWRDQFIESGADGFKRKPDDSAKLIAAERKIGQLQMELELTKKKNELAAKLKRR